MKKLCPKLISVFLSIAIFLNMGYVNAYAITNPLKIIKNEILYDVRLEDDYYTAINKEWLDNAELGKGRVSYGTFEELSSKVNENIQNILCDIKRDRDEYDEESDEIKVLNLYENYLDLEARNKCGYDPIKKYIEKVRCANSIDELVNILSSYEFLYFQSLINLGVGADFYNSSKHVLYLSRSGLGLGNSAYYKEESGKYKKIRKEYLNYIKKLHNLIDEDKKCAKINADNFYRFEKTIAEVTPSVEEEAADSEKIQKSYNVYTVDKVKELFSNINIDKVFDNLGLGYVNEIVVEDPQQVKVINSLLIDKNLDYIKNFMITSILLNSDNLLCDNFRNACKGLKKVLYGIECDKVNEIEASKFVCYELGGIISRLYVAEHFDKKSKIEVMNIANEIKENFEHRINKLTWMSDGTKEQAINKLKNVNVKIGYPDKWKTYEDIHIRRYEDGGDLVENTLNIFMLEAKNQFNKLNKPVDKREWNMEAYAVNAYYNPINNEIVFPAGILQKPFYDRYASKECNLGGIGTVIGHELTHAFDNTGSQFDECGNLKVWWGNNDYNEFLTRSKRVAEYYSNVKVNKNRYVNGELTVGENISDLGGMACVLDIAHKNKDANLRELFENYAAIWREISTEQIQEYLLNNDPHSPKKVRVNVVLSQFNDFYNTYNIKKGDGMYVDEDKRIGIW